MIVVVKWVLKYCMNVLCSLIRIKSVLQVSHSIMSVYECLYCTREHAYMFKGMYLISIFTYIIYTDTRHCHCLSIWLNCLTGQPLGIVGCAEKWLIICTFPMSIPFVPVSLHSLCLTLGQRQSWMYGSFLIRLVFVFAAPEGFLLLSRFIGIPVYT